MKNFPGVAVRPGAGRPYEHNIYPLLRLKNNPIALGSDTLLDLYKKVRDGN